MKTEQGRSRAHRQRLALGGPSAGARFTCRMRSMATRPRTPSPPPPAHIQNPIGHPGASSAVSTASARRLEIFTARGLARRQLSPLQYLPAHFDSQVKRKVASKGRPRRGDYAPGQVTREAPVGKVTAKKKKRSRRVAPSNSLSMTESKSISVVESAMDWDCGSQRRVWKRCWVEKKGRGRVAGRERRSVGGE